VRLGFYFFLFFFLCNSVVEVSRSVAAVGDVEFTPEFREWLLRSGFALTVQGRVVATQSARAADLLTTSIKQGSCVYSESAD